VSLSAAQRELAGSPPALDTLHRDADALLPANQLAARIRALRGYPIVVNVVGLVVPAVPGGVPDLPARVRRARPPRRVRRDRHPGLQGETPGSSSPATQ